MDLGEKIKQLRLERDISQEQLAKRLGISRESISHYENNRIVPPVHILREIAKIFNVSVNYFFEEEHYDKNVKGESELVDYNIPQNFMGFMVVGSHSRGKLLNNKISKKQKGIPVLRFPNPSEGEPENQLIKVRYIDYLQKKDIDYALRLNSDIIEPLIPKGALLLVSTRNNRLPQNGELIVYYLNGKFGVRWYFQKGDNVILIAENSKYLPIITTRVDFKFAGIVKDVIFDFKPQKTTFPEDRD
ncbi:helix-turn-helix domain-containing protein [Thermosipho melanesiensis]|uniref:Transcriptional regulator, XRE family n=2 Tax=Thermosipho melanesiensis TaxID=46541 RepID=A6LK16_THEM4|nr:LexA family transcriptional regulator [Thermosipho melanesiensis]ABR30267.1 transcriptional regulator, XRE family [Thermosipho melanesiensis BI429]APT73450.1 XRE family transcriptional regulator [Thermosipho melanesiensis]